MPISSTEYRRSMQRLVVSEYAPIVDALAHMAVVHAKGSVMPLDMGCEIERVHLAFGQPIERWNHWCLEIGMALSAGCPVHVELDQQCGLWLHFGGNDVWPSEVD